MVLELRGEKVGTEAGAEGGADVTSTPGAIVLPTRASATARASSRRTVSGALSREERSVEDAVMKAAEEEHAVGRGARAGTVE